MKKHEPLDPDLRPGLDVYIQGIAPEFRRDAGRFPTADGLASQAAVSAFISSASLTLARAAQGDERALGEMLDELTRRSRAEMKRLRDARRAI